MNSMKRQKDMTLKDDPLRSVGVQYTTGKDWRNSYRKNEKAKAKQGFPVAQTVKNLPEMQETWVQSLGWEDPLEKEMASHSSILAWWILWKGSLVGYSPRGCKESETTEWLNFTFSLSSQSRNNTQLWLYLVVKVKSNVVKNNIA